MISVVAQRRRAIRRKKGDKGEEGQKAKKGVVIGMQKIKDETKKGKLLLKSGKLVLKIGEL